jgi:hypothetical protein
MKHLEFAFNYRGYGDLVLFDNGNVVDRMLCRTGSISDEGLLVNSIALADWYLTETSVDTEEKAMSTVVGIDGWKIRLYQMEPNGDLLYTHYLIHPDGNLPGTDGCIGIQGTNAEAFRLELDQAVKEQGKVHVNVTKKELYA